MELVKERGVNMKKRKFNLSRLYQCEQAISRWLCGRNVHGITPKMVSDYLVWLHRFHPELRERVNADIEDMTRVYNETDVYLQYNVGQI